MLAYQFAQTCGTPVISQDGIHLMISVPVTEGCGIVQVDTAQVDYSIQTFDAELAMFYVGGALLMFAIGSGIGLIINTVRRARY